jgi:hypothetical protein
MNIGDKVTMKKNALVMGFHKGGAYFRIGKRGAPQIASRQAGTFYRNKYRPLGHSDSFHARGSYHPEIQCYGSHRFEPGDLIGELIDVQDKHIDIIIESSTFDTYNELDKAFKFVVGIELDKNTTDAFVVFPKADIKGTQ